MGAFFDRKVIKDIDKNDVGSIVYQTDQNRNWIVHVGYTGYTSFYNCYERDWINSNKDLGAITINGQTSTMQGHRKYYDEWYAFDPSSVHNFALDYNSLNAGNTVTTHSNSKGQMTVKHTP